MQTLGDDSPNFVILNCADKYNCNIVDDKWSSTRVLDLLYFLTV